MGIYGLTYSLYHPAWMNHTGRVLNEMLCAKKISEVNLSAFIYRLFLEDFLLTVATNKTYKTVLYSFRQLRRNLQINEVKLSSEIFVLKKL